ncbi:2,2-dialkylglycine decarboxylase [Colletotrichum spaethianum]|uniref:2,2-dialkylglycine decarboxylase n=1 Tax=Colletotrichum spaethianum TaxID=700344 RepID=A0AA37L855_9PEZI|nr:2,2-dialkylglycine decarboxylase [Colletotrichum spaethianum]GKT43603.1 2,2-dialkylglycine decarboxylase [Colletotrichum spaethianum]
MVPPPVISLSLSERLYTLLPPGLYKVLFLSIGDESNETAFGMAKAITCKFDNWHGVTTQALEV